MLLFVKAMKDFVRAFGVWRKAGEFAKYGKRQQNIDFSLQVFVEKFLFDQ